MRCTNRPEPLTRRNWITAAAATTTLALFPRALQAKRRAKSLPALSFIVISDTHLGYKDNDGAAKQWAKTAADVKGQPGEFVLHLGDVVDGGREEMYVVYKESRDAIGKPVYEIPGNHDPHDAFERHLRRPIDTVVKQGDVWFALVGNAHRDSHDGFLTLEQLDWLRQQCVAAQQASAVMFIALHVPVHHNVHPDRGWYVKPANGQSEFYALLQEFQNTVLATLHGHFHNGLRGWTDHTPVHEIVFPSALYNLDRKLEAQNAPGYNPIEFRPGFTLVELRDETLTLRYKPTAADVAVTRPLPLGRVTKS